LKPITRRKWMLGAAAGAAGCTRRRSEAATDSITILYPYDDTVLGPAMDEPAQFLMFLPLVAWNSRGELEGRLAEAWEHSPDYRTWTIRLREGIRWHDGVPVTAYDIKFNLEAAFDPALQDQLFTEITELFQQDVPATALYPMVLTTIASRRVRGLDHCPYRGDLTWCMDDLALEEQA